jgi:peroxiredoxin
MQLVELQETAASSSDLAVYAISYDPVDVLADFGARHGISYRLLSDVGSIAMSALGVLNRSIAADQAYWGWAYEDKHHGLPYPGSFVLDPSGIVVDKRFERSHRNRRTSRSVVEDLGLVAAGDGAEVSATAAADGITAAAYHATASVFPNQVSTVRVDVALDPGVHVFVPPTSGGYTLLEASIEAPDGVFWDEPDPPSGEPFLIDGIDDELQVVEGRAALEIPFHVHEKTGETVRFTIVVRYQACSATICLPPGELRLELSLVVRPKM